MTASAGEGGNGIDRGYQAWFFEGDERALLLGRSVQASIEFRAGAVWALAEAAMAVRAYPNCGCSSFCECYGRRSFENCAREIESLGGGGADGS